MKIPLIFTLLFAGAFASYFPPLHDSTCGFTRDQAFDCIRRYTDTDHSEAVTHAEVDAALKKYAPWYIRAAAFFVGTKRIFKDCDYDKNGVLTARDWKLSAKTCMPTQENLCTLKWFCDRAASSSPELRSGEEEKGERFS